MWIVMWISGSTGRVALGAPGAPVGRDAAEHPTSTIPTAYTIKLLPTLPPVHPNTICVIHHVLNTLRPIRTPARLQICSSNF